MRNRSVPGAPAIIAQVFSASAEAALPATDGFLPSVGKGPVASGSERTTTLWIRNPGPEPADVEISHLVRNRADPAPLTYGETTPKGSTRKVKNALGVGSASTVSAPFASSPTDGSSSTAGSFRCPAVGRTRASASSSLQAPPPSRS